jgi:hypothetical protein
MGAAYGTTKSSERVLFPILTARLISEIIIRLGI